MIPDYRRVRPDEQAVYPSGGEDTALVLAWLQSQYASGSHALYISGSSAGAVHTATYLLSPAFSSSRHSMRSVSSVTLAGAILISMPAHFDAHATARADVLKAYYGERIKEDAPCGLVGQAEGDVDCDVLVINGTLEPEEEILGPSRRFVELFEERAGKERLTVGSLEGHNHFSTVLGLGTGIEREESLGTAVLKWIDERR